MDARSKEAAEISTRAVESSATTREVTDAVCRALRADNR